MQEFDRFASEYHQVLDSSLTLSGEVGEYFAEGKARYVAGEFSSDFCGRILDYGCGIGILSNCLRRHLPMASLDGFDVSADSIKRIDPKLAAHGLYTANSAELAFNYNVIVVSNVLHHIETSERQCIVEDLSHRLCEDGFLVIFEHNPLNPVTRWVVRNSPLDENAVLLFPGEALAYGARVGLKVCKKSYLFFFPRPLASLRGCEPYLTWCPLGAQYAVVLKRPKC
jgi:SAM-dependent methyltransferase